jgi:hypothetical protein
MPPESRLSTRHFFLPAFLSLHRDNDPMAFRLAAISLRQILRLLSLRFRSSRSKDLELLVLRQELDVSTVRCPAQGSDPKSDGCSPASSACDQSGDRLSSLVTPDTIRRWHRDLVRAKWHYRHWVVSRGRIPDHVRLLVWRLASENPTWGSKPVPRAPWNGIPSSPLAKHGVANRRVLPSRRRWRVIGARRFQADRELITTWPRGGYRIKTLRPGRLLHNSTSISRYRRGTIARTSGESVRPEFLGSSHRGLLHRCHDGGDGAVDIGLRCAPA